MKFFLKKKPNTPLTLKEFIDLRIMDYKFFIYNKTKFL